jgi:1-deoxy-D-xylulose-5-phosphate reductoisomerase
MKKIAILGSTGSIGVSSLKVIDANPGEFEVVALAAGKNVELLGKQVERYRPKWVAALEKDTVERLAARAPGEQNTEYRWGPEGFMQVATLEEIDTVVSAMSGAAGLIPTFAAIKAGKNIALANKETMVMAGPLVMEHANRQGVSILPIDSEHSAILQSLQGHSRDDIKRIIITASGGPFREFTLEDMQRVTPAQALDHPNWDMGRKITIDSATMMNKGLEIIEARWLFDLQMEQISVIVHPQSIVHSMVEYRDGSIIAQLGIPDMITPISYALFYPSHLETRLPPLRLEAVKTLSFHEPDPERFRCLALAIEASAVGESMPAVLNGANEVAVEAFLGGKIGFLQIPQLIERTMKAHDPFTIDHIKGVLEADRWARQEAERQIRLLNH